MSMLPDLTIKQSALYTLTAIKRESKGGPVVDLTGYTAKMQIRDVPGGTLIHDATSGITITPAEGKVVVQILASDTANFDFVKAWYDLLLIPSTGSDYAERLLEGAVKLDKGVTT